MVGEIPTERVSLSVQQPERHSIFIASSPSMEGCMAVASASLDVQAAVGMQYYVRNTFVEGIDGLPQPRRSTRRLRTMPALPRTRSFAGGCNHSDGRATSSAH